MDAALILSRLQAGAAYLAALENSAYWDWFEKYAVLEKGQLSVVEALALVHPQHYQELDTDLRIRGPRQFNQEAAMSSIGCQAEFLGGYPCQRPVGSVVAADHLFPYSLGGPTVGSNKVYLCRLHNQMKSNDIHLYPWERGLPVWLLQTAAAVAKLKQVPK